MILIIDNYDSFTYNLYQVIATIYPKVEVVRNDKLSLSDIAQIKPAGILLSPGPGRPEEAGICMDLIRSIEKTSIPLLGVCLGHQAIAAAFGGKVVQAPQIIHGKRDYIFHCQRGLYRDMPLPFEAGRYHSLIVDRATLPNVLQVESVNPAGLLMGLRHRTLPIYGVQFHPESILTPQGNTYLHQFVEVSRRASCN